MSPYTAGTNVELTCTVTGANPAATIQWVRGSSLVAGETSTTLTISTAAESGNYRCVANNSQGNNSGTSGTITIV